MSAEHLHYDETEALTFKCYLIIINLNSHRWLLATILDSADLGSSLK